MPLRMELCDLVFKTRERKLQPVQLHTEQLPAAAAAGEFVKRLSRRKRQPQELPGAIHHLSGGKIARAADALGVHVFSFRRDEQQLRRAAR